MSIRRNIEVTVKLKSSEWAEVLQAARIRGYSEPWPTFADLPPCSRLAVEHIVIQGLIDHARFINAGRAIRRMDRGPIYGKRATKAPRKPK